MNKIYRPGAIGALTDEYEKALIELKLILKEISNNQFRTKNEDVVEVDFQSIQNITMHIIKSGYVYSNHIRKRFGNSIHLYEIIIEDTESALTELDKMFNYAVETFNDKWLLTDDELLNTIIKTSWTTYDLEALIEHSIVHVLRHRLQIQKILIKM
jgi:uncharacterized damage-inducible protein DinB